MKIIQQHFLYKSRPSHDKKLFQRRKDEFYLGQGKVTPFFLPQVFEEGKAISSIFSPFIFFPREFSLAAC